MNAKKKVGIIAVVVILAIAFIAIAFLLYRKFRFLDKGEKKPC